MTLLDEEPLRRREPPRPIDVGLLTGSDLMTAGLQAVLTSARGRILAQRAAPAGAADHDVLLVGPLATATATAVLARPDPPAVIGIGWEYGQEPVDAVLRSRARALLPLGAPAPEIIHTIETIFAAGDRVDPAVEEGVLPLSRREQEVLGLICAGLSNQEIAEQLFLSINSVKTYVRTAYRKIGASRRSQAVVWGLNHGL